MKRKLIDAPSSYAITLAEAKAHLHVDSTDDDSYITSLIAVATEAVQNYSGWQLIGGVYEIALDGFPEDYIDLMPVPYWEGLKVTYKNTAGSTIDITSSCTVDDYSSPPRVYHNSSWPTDIYDGANSVKVEFTAGYEEAQSVPAVLKQAMLLMIGHYYEHREDQSDRQTYELPQASKWLMDQLRIYNF